MRTSFFHSVFVIPLFACISAQGGKLPIRDFTTDNGLPHNRVNSIYKDSSDFLWISTDGGLSRFDGRESVNYTTASGLPHSHVNAFLETRDGYWLGTDAGLVRFDPAPNRQRFTTYTPPPFPGSQAVNTLVQDADGTLLIGTNSGLFRFSQAQSPEFIPIEYHPSHDGPGSTKINAILRDRRGRLWLATEYGLYQRTNVGVWIPYGKKEGLQFSFIFSLIADPQGRVWAGFRGGFARLATDPGPNNPIFDLSFTRQTGLRFTDARALLLSRGGRFWIATEAGLFEWLEYSSHGRRFRHYVAAEGLKEEQTQALSEDSAGNLWIGTRRSGLTCLRQTAFRKFDPSDGLSFSGDQVLLTDRSGDVCIFDAGQHRRRIFCRGKIEGRFQVQYPAVPARFDGEDPHWLEMAHADPGGGWWFSSAHGMFFSQTLESAPSKNFGPHTTRFFEDAAGDLWIAAMFKDRDDKRGLLHWQRSVGNLIDETAQLPRAGSMQGIGSFAQDHNGDLWLGLERPGGLLVRRRSGRFDQIAGAPAGHINQLLVDSKGRIWITSTEEGIGRIDDPASQTPHIQRYRRSEGLSSEEVWCLVEDHLGLIYAGTSRGVDRLDPLSGAVSQFTSEDGLPSGDIRSALSDGSGDLWFASSHGVAQYRPGPARFSGPPPTRISGLRVAGTPLPLSELGVRAVGPLQFSSYERSVEINFRSTDFHFFAPLRYEFRSEAGGDWQPAGSGSSLNLVNLASGSYDIQIRALAPGGERGEAATVTFSIAQPLWKRPWFLLAAAAGVLGIIYSIHVYRMDKQIALERVRTQIATDLHDDIGASLSRIYIVGEAIRSKYRETPAEAAGMLDEIVGSSRRLLTDMNDIVWSLNAKRDSFADLASRLRAFGSDVLESRGIEWNVEASAGLLSAALAPHIRRQLYVLFKEGINNVGKHSKASKALLRFSSEGSTICGELFDNGCGLPAASASELFNGNGLSNMRTRAEAIGGNLTIDSPAGTGTRLIVRLPIGKHVHALPRRA